LLRQTDAIAITAARAAIVHARVIGYEPSILNQSTAMREHRQGAVAGAVGGIKLQVTDIPDEEAVVKHRPATRAEYIHRAAGDGTRAISAYFMRFAEHERDDRRTSVKTTQVILPSRLRGIKGGAFRLIGR
jgi:hypothetical protein